jgi:hypothetical protein
VTPGLFQAVFAGVTLLILWSTTLAGAVVWIVNRISKAKEEIMADFNTKHEANLQTVKALETLVIRHDVMLNSEFNGYGKGTSRHS